LIVEFDDLEARLIAIGMAVIAAKGQLALHGGRAVMPEPFIGRYF